MATTFKFILLGKSGNGKSATGNSILGKNVFFRQSSCVAHVTKPSAGSSVLSSTHVTVVDGLNFYRCQEKSDFSEVEEALSLCSDEFSALLIVLKFGARFGEEDINVLKMAKTVFGENVLKDFGICVLTHGDNFSHVIEEEEETFVNVQQWFDQQTGKVQDLFNECGRRCVLFDNNTKSAQVKAEQVKDLLCIVRNMPRRYTLRDFEDAQKGRRSFVRSEKFTEVKMKSEQLLSSVKKDLQLLENDPTKQACDFDLLLSKLKDQITQVNKVCGEGTKYATEIIVPMSAVLMEVKSKMRGKTSTRELSNNKCRHSDKTDTKGVARPLRQSDKTDTKGVARPLRQSDKTDTKGVTRPLRQSDKTDTKGVARPDVGEVQKDRQQSSENFMILEEYQKMEKEMLNFEELAQQNLKIWIKKLHAMLWELKKGTEERKIVVSKLKSDVIKLQRLNEIYGGNPDDIHSLMIKLDHDIIQSEEPEHKQKSLNTIESSHSTPPREMNLVLMGKSGNGKSSTANSILGRKAFKITSSTTTSFGHCCKESSQVQSIKVNILDGPGVDTRQSTPHVLEASLNIFKEYLELCEYQFSALVLVLQYGVPFSKQEVEIVRMIKGVLGNDVIKKFGVCVLTRGDNYEFDMQDEQNPVKFEDWCRQQTDDLGSLFKECNFRCVLFDNKTQDETVARGQVERLLSLVRPDVTYSKADFMKGLGGLKEYVWKSSLSDLMKRSTQFMDDIQRRRAENERVATSDYEAYVSELKKIFIEIGEYTQLIQGIGSNSKELKSVLQMLEIASREIKTKLKVAEEDKNMKHRSAVDFPKRQGDVFKETHSHERDENVVIRTQNILGSRDTSSFPRSTQYVKEVNAPQRGSTLSYNTPDDRLAEEVRISLRDIRRKLSTLRNDPHHSGVMLNSLIAAVREQREKCELICKGSRQTEELISNIRELSEELNDVRNHADIGSKVIDQKWLDIRKSFKLI